MSTTETRRIGPLTILSIERGRNSTNGNPSFTLHTNEGSYRTQADAALGYGIENLTNSRFPDTYVIGNLDAQVVLLATPKTRVWGIEYKGKVLR